MTISKITSDSIGALEITHAKLHTDMDLSAKTITLPASVRGPATLTLDPATVGDNTGTVVIAGSLTVNGTTTTVNSNTVNIGDNLLVLNSDETGTPSQNSGIEIERGTSTNVSLRWNETTDNWQFTNDGTTYNNLGSSDIVDDTTPQLGGNLDAQSNNISNVGTLSVTNINTTGSGSTNISAGANIELDATNRVLITDTPFRLASLTTTQRNAIASPANGDMIYNSTTNQIESYENSSWTDTARSSGSTVVSDTTPQLGGNLDLNSNNITGTGDISVTGNISASGDITTTNSGSTTNVMKLRYSASGTHEIHVDPTNQSGFSALRLSVDGDAFMYLSATSQNVFFSKPIQLSNTANTITFEGATADSFETILTVTDPTADRTITLPDSDGTVMMNVVEDTTPQLGGQLDLNGQTITGTLNIDYDTDAVAYIGRAAIGYNGYTDVAAFGHIDMHNVNQNSGLTVNPASHTTLVGYNQVLINTNSQAGYAGAQTAQFGHDIGMKLTNSYLTGSGIVYQGDYNKETTLTINGTQTGDRTIYLPDASGTVAVNIATDSSSIILGDNSGTLATAATNTTVLGQNALTAGNLVNATAIGKGAMELLPSGNSNTAVGYQALRSSSSGNGAALNTAVGYNTFTSITTGDYNVVLGYNSNMPRGYYSNSVAIGNAADINGSNQVMIGNNAGGAVSTSYTNANQCIGIGDFAYYGNGSGDYNTCVGGQNMRQYYVTSSYNVALGYNAMRNANGAYNVAIGYNSLYTSASTTSISNNIGIGDNAGRYNRGANNVYLGSRAGHGASTTNLTGNNKIIIGRDAEPSSASISNEITLGNSSITALRCQVTSITALSDERDKTAIEDLDLGLDFIKAMKPRKFAWNRRDGKYLGKQELGFIAQELYEVEQDFASTSRTRLVNFNNPSKLEAQPMNTYPILVKAIQELSAKVDSLQAEVNTLKNGG